MATRSKSSRGVTGGQARRLACASVGLVNRSTTFVIKTNRSVSLLPLGSRPRAVGDAVADSRVCRSQSTCKRVLQQVSDALRCSQPHAGYNGILRKIALFERCGRIYKICHAGIEL